MRSAEAKDVTEVVAVHAANQKKRKEEKRERKRGGLRPSSLFTENLGLLLPKIYRVVCLQLSQGYATLGWSGLEQWVKILGAQERNGPGAGTPP